jgi:hypothetical protein
MHLRSIIVSNERYDFYRYPKHNSNICIYLVNDIKSLSFYEFNLLECIKTNRLDEQVLTVKQIASLYITNERLNSLSDEQLRNKIENILLLKSKSLYVGVI